MAAATAEAPLGGCEKTSLDDPTATTARAAMCFLQATTKQSSNRDDILPQEAGLDLDLSPFFIFASSFPEFFSAGHAVSVITSLCSREDCAYTSLALMLSCASRGL